MSTSMKPVAICQHAATQGPAYLQTFLQRYQLPFELFTLEGTARAPLSSQDFSAVVVLGSDASVHDRLRWIEREAQLVTDAVCRQRPVLGICFGGQLLARLLGAQVYRQCAPHVGWDLVQRTAYPEAQQRLGQAAAFPMFHWHQETFQIPAGARRLLFNRCCRNTAFSYGPHLALQAHPEVTADSVRTWCLQDPAVFSRYPQQDSVQPQARILAQLHDNIATLHQAADQIFLRFLAQIPKARPLLPLLQELRQWPSAGELH